MKSGESPTKQGPDVQKVPPVAAPAGLIWKLHKNAMSDLVLLSYLEVPFVVVIQGFEKLIWPRDVRNHLKFSLPIPETNVK